MNTNTSTQKYINTQQNNSVINKQYTQKSTNK